MSTPAASNPTQTPTQSMPKQLFLDLFEEEFQRTMRLLRSFPKDQSELRPHDKSKNARELAWMFVVEQGAAEKALTTGFDWSKPPQFPPAPDSFDGILGAIEQGHQKIAGLIRNMPEEDLTKTIKFFTGPGKIGDMPRMQFLWMMLRDQIHHRGQFSVYQRMAGGKVPSIYGPSLDEPFF